MPSIDTVMPIDEKLPSTRHDATMVSAFGLENDKNHWKRMKEYGMKLCQEELPPQKLSVKVKQKTGLPNDEYKKLEYDDGVKATRDYVWEFLSVPWRKQFDYDIQYLQKRYPDASVKKSFVASSRDGTIHIAS